jgi:hypothetical protein
LQNLGFFAFFNQKALLFLREIRDHMKPVAGILRINYREDLMNFSGGSYAKSENYA